VEESLADVALHLASVQADLAVMLADFDKTHPTAHLPSSALPWPRQSWQPYSSDTEACKQQVGRLLFSVLIIMQGVDIENSYLSMLHSYKMP
jgi:hypothetical protein